MKFAGSVIALIVIAALSLVTDVTDASAIRRIEGIIILWI